MEDRVYRVGAGGKQALLMAWKLERREMCLPRRFAMIEDADIRKQNFILLRGVAGISMSVLKGVFSILEMYNLK